MDDSSLPEDRPRPDMQDVTVDRDLWVVDVSGAEGEPGRDGTSYAGRSAAGGQHGRDGSDAGPPRPGQTGGRIHVQLAARAQTPGMVELVGHAVPPAGRQQPLREHLAYSAGGSIRLIANGGTGGRGGRGGDGEAGGAGRDGSDATRFSSGSDGGPGGNGGHGGAGTSGAPGGDGGQIVVEVAIADTDLLMLLSHQVDGGPGGPSGSNGHGGAGGRGGRGGSSHSWTTTSSESYTDHEGKRQSRVVTHHHRNPGGSDGRAGQSGRDGRGVLSAGPPGTPGTMLIRVRDDRHTIEYLRRYEIEIVDYRLVVDDQFAEPTSTLEVASLRVRNTGGMPSPAGHPVKVRLTPGRWATPSSPPLAIPRSLAPGEEYLFVDEKLTARVADIEATPFGAPLRQHERINPLAVQSRVERLFLNQHPRLEFEVSFPSELGEVESLESLTPGRAARLRATLVNRSRQSLGAKSPQGRRLGVRIELDNQEMAPHVMLLDGRGNPIAWRTGYREEVELLEPDASVSSEVIVGILPSTPGYTKAALRVTLELGRREEPDVVRDCHCRPFPIRVAQAYAFDPAADLLLITNHGTTTDELAAWHRTAASLGLRLNVWDISLNDSLSLSAELEHGQNLLRDFHGKTVVLSNAPFSTAIGTRYGEQFVSQMDLIHAIASHSMRVLVLNDPQHNLSHLFQERLIPTDGEPEYRYGSASALIRAKPLDDVDVLFDQVDELVRHGHRAARPDPLRQTSEVDLFGIRSPHPSRLRRQAQRLQRRLQHAAPGRRVVVMYQLPSEMEAAEREQRARQAGSGGFFFTHVHQGTLTVMPTLGDHHPNLIVLQAPEAQIHDSEFVAGAAVRSALIQALSFEEKIYLLSEKLREIGQAARLDPQGVDPEDVQVAETTVDAMLIDLSVEQAAALKGSWNPPWSAPRWEESLTLLRRLADHPFSLIAGEASQQDMQLAIRLIAGIEFLGRHCSRWYESWGFPWSPFRRGPAVGREVRRRAKLLERNLLGESRGERRQRIDEQVRRYGERLARLKRTRRLDNRSAAWQVIAAPLSDLGVETDTGAVFPAVLSYAQWEQVRRAEAEREQARIALAQKKEHDRGRFALAEGGVVLPETDEPTRRALQPFVDACSNARQQLASTGPQQRTEEEGAAGERTRETRDTRENG